MTNKKEFFLLSVWIVSWFLGLLGLFILLTQDLPRLIEGTATFSHLHKHFVLVPLVLAGSYCGHVWSKWHIPSLKEGRG